MFRRLSLAAALAALSVAYAAAYTVGVVPAEGLEYAPPPGGGGSPIDSLVSGCMDAFFDLGCVVTDAQPRREASSSWLESPYDAADARVGKVDYVLALYAEWRVSQFNKDVVLPRSVAYRLYRVADGRLLLEGSVDGSPDSEDAARHYDRSAELAGERAARACAAPLAAQVNGGER
jgi:hypothetical protein